MEKELTTARFGHLHSLIHAALERVADLSQLDNMQTDMMQ